ncbi:predicted protein [Nematostella vectensis]|uniref:Uncharacterized protein n=1 Tax=Nematostella vectensis TaxID=45351 RepID=A7SEN9_NEMVE|nr:predicted protein [Nematostella vectensis]|eukprot:XP_001629884.1 predicted protein [Nematostella vectensis]
MRSVLVCLLLASWVALLRAEDEIDEMLMEDEDMSKCRMDFRVCMNGTSDAADRKKCYEAYRKCVSDNQPRPSYRPRPTMPAHVAKCQMELKNCLNGSSGVQDKFKCFYQFKKCMFENRPFLQKCKALAAICMKQASKDSKERFACRTAFMKCLKDNQPDSDEKLEDIEDTARPTKPAFLEKCKQDLRLCLNGSFDVAGKLKCVASFKKCLFENRPTPPPFMQKCKALAAICMKQASKDSKERFACRTAFMKCVKDNKPDSDEELEDIQDAARPTKPAFVEKCKQDLRLCLNGSDVAGKLKCVASFKKCLFKNRPIPPPFVVRPQRSIISSCCHLHEAGWRGQEEEIGL